MKSITKRITTMITISVRQDYCINTVTKNGSFSSNRSVTHTDNVVYMTVIQCNILQKATTQL